MQAIITKYLPATNFKGSRIKAKCERGSIIVSHDSAASLPEGPHVAAAQALVDKFVKEDAERYGTDENPWNARRVIGGLPGGEYAHVFVY